MPLTGVRVLDLSRLLPGPFAGMVLAGLGADVVKVEDLGGGDYLRWMGAQGSDTSAMFTALNRGKRSVTLDLKNPRGRSLFLALGAGADVVIESFRPGVLEKLGLGIDELHAVNPRLVLCRISGFGQDGPDQQRAGHDLNYLARSGILSITGTQDGRPAIPGVQMADMGGGGLGAVVAILAALRLRERTGRGSVCDVSMLDGLLAWVAPQVAARVADGGVTGRGLMILNGAHPCYRVYRCADGEVTVAALEPKFWSRLCELLGLDAVRDDGFATGARAEEVSAAVEAVLMTRSRAQWREHLGQEDVCVEPVLTIDEMVMDPQVQHRGGGTALPSWFPVRVGDSTAAPSGDAPHYGADSREVLAEIGIDEDEFASLVASGVTR
jgi:alpha-methylacyl-CoA racemase